MMIKYVILNIFWVLAFIPLRSLYADQTKFIFGISAPLSGVLAEYGNAVKNGIELAKKDRPREFNNIEVVFEDSQWDPKTAVAAFNMLRQVKKAQLIYNWGNPTSDAVAPIAERLKLPLMAMSSDPAIVKNRKYIIRTLRSGEELGNLLAERLKEKGYKKIAVLLAENTYVQGLYQGLLKSLENSSTSVELIGRFSLSEQDFKSVISRIKPKGYDAIGVLLITGQVRSFFRQLQAQSLVLPTFGADFFGSKSEIDASGPGIEGAIFPDIGVTEDFRKRYIQVYRNDTQIAFAANAYDVATQVALTFSGANLKQLNAESVLQMLRDSKPLNGAHGIFYFEDSTLYGPAFVSDLVIRKINNGNIVNY